MLDELGPTFVKFGQLLSTRPDLVPPDIIAELRKLQDEVSPVPDRGRRAGRRGGARAHRSSGRSSSSRRRPIAAASIGQVHRATLPNGAEVVVKVQRPTAPRQIESDLRLMASAARVVRERVRAARLHRRERARRRVRALDPARARLPAGGAERRDVPAELRRRRADRRARASGGATRRAALLTLDRLRGDARPRPRPRRAWAPTTGAQLAYTMTDAWMTMIFRHAFFHGDPHPGQHPPSRRRAARARRLRACGAAHGDDMTRLTRLFVDAATENVSALPRRLADSGVRYPRDREDGASLAARGALLPLLRLAALGHRPDRGDPRRARR